MQAYVRTYVTVATQQKWKAYSVLKNKGGQMTKPIIVKMPCKLLYIIQVKRLLLKGYNFLALPDIKVFGRL